MAWLLRGVLRDVPVHSEKGDSLCFRGASGVLFLRSVLCDEILWYAMHSKTRL